MARRYSYYQKVSATRGIKKAHKKAKWVGILYFIGTVVVSLLSLFGCLNIELGKLETVKPDGLLGAVQATVDKPQLLSILSMLKPFAWIIDGKNDGLFVFSVFFIMSIILIVNFLRSFDFLRKALKKNDRNINACNRNITAMENCGDLFSKTFSTVVICYTLIYASVVNIESEYIRFLEGGLLTMFGIIVLAVGLLVHFVAGGFAATSSLFVVGATIDEKRREDKVSLFVLRSLIKVLVALSLVYFFVPYSQLHLLLKVLEFKLDDPVLMENILTVLMQLIAIIFLCICIRKALSTLEFNLFGMDAYGMRKFAVFSLLFGIICIVLFVLSAVMVPADSGVATVSEAAGEGASSPVGYLIAGAIAIAGFVLDFVVKPKERAIVLDAEKPATPPAPAQEKPVHKPHPAPAIPSSIDVRLVLPKSKEADAKVGELPTKWEVICPSCGKTLMVKEAPYGRCPACGKVFQLSVGKIATGATAENVEAQKPVEELAVSEDKKTKKVKKVKKEKGEAPVKTEKKVKQAKKEKKGKKGEAATEQAATPTPSVEE